MDDESMKAGRVVRMGNRSPVNVGVVSIVEAGAIFRAQNRKRLEYGAQMKTNELHKGGSG